MSLAIELKAFLCCVCVALNELNLKTFSFRIIFPLEGADQNRIHFRQIAVVKSFLNYLLF